MTDLCHPINRKISARKTDGFHLNYSMEKGRVYINSPIEKKMVYFNDNLRDFLGFKWNIIESNGAGTINGWNVFFFFTFDPVSHQTTVYSLMNPFDISRAGQTNVPSCVFLNKKLLTNTFTTTI